MELGPKISAIETTKGDTEVSDLTLEEETRANLNLAQNQAETARLELEEVANEKVSQEDRQRQIDEILKSLKK
ncbi:MAG: hypothetical protein HY225_01455 [Candidatus Vogelbacteria bacterium]|nr:hypothetical protein [Candidatus Vogelbacteria bacterium]